MSRAEGFAPIPTWMLRDKNISRRACLVYASLSSRSGLGAIYPSQATIAEESGVSERTVRSALIELESLGVIERRTRRGREGRANGLTTAYVLHPNGRIEEAADIAGRNERPAKDDERPATSDRATGNELQGTPLIEAENQEAEIKKADGRPSFDDFWAIWPRRDAKKTASAAWDRAIKRADPQLIIDAARAYAEHPHRPEKKFVPYAATWLNGDRWHDPLPEAAPPPQTFARQRQSNSLAIFEHYTNQEKDHAEVGTRQAAHPQALDRGW